MLDSCVGQLVQMPPKAAVSTSRRTLEDLRLGENISGSDPSHLDVLPLWLDRERFHRGQLFFQRRITSVTFAFHCSLVCGFSVPNLLHVLVHTQQTDTPQKALKRYLETFHHLLVWHTGDVWHVGSRAHRSLGAVRIMHARAASDMRKLQPNMIHVSQYDMALVQCGFMGAVILYPHQLGVSCSVEELEDYIYFWKCIGYLLGMEDKFNLCDSAEYEPTMTLVREIEQKILLPQMRNPTADCCLLTDAYCLGVNRILGLPLFTKEAVYALVFDFANVPVPKLSWKDWARYHLYKLFLRLIKNWSWLNMKLNDYVLQNFYLYEQQQAMLNAPTQ